MKWIWALILIVQFSFTKPERTLPDVSSGLFESSEVLEMTLSGSLNVAFKDRAEKSNYYPAILSYRKEDSSRVSIKLNIKTRGHFRKALGNCQYPPLQLSFSKDATPAGSLFDDQEKLKLVTPCSSDDYVVREYLVYKLYNLITEKSFRARLVRVTYDDTVKRKKSKPLYGIILEDEAQMASRNGSVITESQLLYPQQTNRDTFLKMAVFEYLIGNTDWSVQYRQNIKLITNQTNELPYTVPYDFDHAGIVSAPYAQPAAELEMSSVRERRYRGYCIELFQLNETFNFFEELKPAIYKLYSDNVILDEKYKKVTTKFLDDFYATLHNEKKRNADFGYPCRKDGTGNVVIKGLAK